MALCFKRKFLPVAGLIIILVTSPIVYITIGWEGSVFTRRHIKESGKFLQELKEVGGSEARMRNRDIPREFGNSEDDQLCWDLLLGAAEGNSTNPRPDVTTDEQVWKTMQDGCDMFKKRFLFDINEDPTYITDEEVKYPIAFSILAHENANQLIQLLSAIYTPHNVYCIHLDRKSPDALKNTVNNLNTCFPNVFRSIKSEDIVYAGFSRLQADINCMNDLLDHKVRWIHLINMCSQDFPLRTNLEMVQQLKVLKGRNAIGGHPPSEGELERTKYVYKVGNVTRKNAVVERALVRTDQLKSPVPHDMKVFKNLAYNVYARPFLHWALRVSQKAKDLLEWSKDTYSPDEHYWRMLDELKGEAPACGIRTDEWQVSRHIQWFGPKKKCAGYWRHYICVFGARDLEYLCTSHVMFVNKLDSRFDSLPLICLRKWLDERKSHIHARNPPKLPVIP